MTVVSAHTAAPQQNPAIIVGWLIVRRISERCVPEFCGNQLRSNPNETAPSQGRIQEDRSSDAGVGGGSGTRRGEEPEMSEGLLDPAQATDRPLKASKFLCSMFTC